VRGLARERLVKFSLGEAFQQPGNLRQQVGPPGRELAQRGHRGGLLIAAEPTPPGVVLRLAGKLGDQEPISLRTLTDHVF